MRLSFKSQGYDEIEARCWPVPTPVFDPRHDDRGRSRRPRRGAVVRDRRDRVKWSGGLGTIRLTFTTSDSRARTTTRKTGITRMSQSAVYPPQPDAADLVAAARHLSPMIRELRDESERERRLPANVLSAMHEARLFRMYVPMEY